MRFGRGSFCGVSAAGACPGRGQPDAWAMAPSSVQVRFLQALLQMHQPQRESFLALVGNTGTFEKSRVFANG